MEDKALPPRIMLASGSRFPYVYYFCAQA